MPIKADYHMHSIHSYDSDAPISSMIESSIEKGLSSICFTEHMDFNSPSCDEYPEHAWECNVDSYLYDLISNKNKYADKIEVNFGLELGLTRETFRENALAAKAHEFDFIIGSIHFVNNMDTYWPRYFEGRSEKEALNEYFKATLDNIRMFNNFDVLGHMDYIVRTSPGGEATYNPADYEMYIEDILSTLIEKEKGIEINTSQLKKGFTYANPHLDILKKYKEMGGEIVTIGSDAHTPEHVGIFFDKAEEFLKEAGFKYYTTFSNRIAAFHKL